MFWKGFILYVIVKITTLENIRNAINFGWCDRLFTTITLNVTYLAEYLEPGKYSSCTLREDEVGVKTEIWRHSDWVSCIKSCHITGHALLFAVRHRKGQKSKSVLISTFLQQIFYSTFFCWCGNMYQLNGSADVAQRIRTLLCWTRNHSWQVRYFRVLVRLTALICFNLL